MNYQYWNLIVNITKRILNIGKELLLDIQLSIENESYIKNEF